MINWLDYLQENLRFLFSKIVVVCDDKSWPSSAHLTILLTFNFMGIA